jgi:hypothetical protein
LERGHHITLLDRLHRGIGDDAIAQLPALNGEEISMPEFYSKQMNPFKTAALVDVPEDLRNDVFAWGVSLGANWARCTCSGAPLVKLVGNDNRLPMSEGHFFRNMGVHVSFPSFP